MSLEVFYQGVELYLPYHELSPTVGKKMLPSRRITYFEEGFFLGKTNKYGYLGNSYPPQRNPGTIRIGLIGDSFTEGFQVFEQYHFSQILERLLNKDSTNSKYEVLNFGVGNYNYNDMIILYKNVIEDYNCDILVFIVEENDFEFRENFIPSPLLEISNDSLIIDYSFTNSNTYKYYKKYSFLFENSCVVKSINSAYKLAKKDLIKEIILDRFYHEPDSLDKDSKYFTEAPKKAIDLRIIKSLDWIRSKKICFVFKGEISDDLRITLTKNKIPCMSVLPILEERLTAKGISYDYWDVTNSNGHWNHSAQVVVGETLYDLIKSYEK